MTIAHRMPDVGQRPDSSEHGHGMGMVAARPGAATAPLAAAPTAAIWIEQLRLLPHMTPVASPRS